MPPAAETILLPIMPGPTLEYDYNYDFALDSGLASQRQFRKHKTLPRPHSIRRYDPLETSPPGPKRYDLIIDTSRPVNSGSQSSSPRTLKHQSKRIGSGPDLPPTPPRHSRKSSSNSSGVPSSPTIADPSYKTSVNAPPRALATPPNQQSPPTPDVTPPQLASRPKTLRPIHSDQGGSHATTVGSRTDSFRTAREEPLSSEDEEKKSTVSHTIDSSTSQITVRRVKDNSKPQPKPNGLGLALPGLSALYDDGHPSRSKTDFGQFDGDWSSVGEVEQEWDDNLQRMVTVKTRSSTPPTDPSTAFSNKVVPDNSSAIPTNAAKAVRHMPLHSKAEVIPSPRVLSNTRISPGPSSTNTSISTDARRTSVISTRSTVSTVVEAILVDGPPRRQRTLRHVRKQLTLRDPASSSPSSNADSVLMERAPRESRRKMRPEDSRFESYASNTTVNSISSSKARREVWRSGGIPVVVVPDRRSSSKSKSSKEPSLHSTSSRRSNRTKSVSSSTIEAPASKDVTSKDVGPVFQRPHRRHRTYSESDGSDERTLDFPPEVPRRSSSLSAPTSRNVSRAGSLTAESIKIHNALQDALAKQSQEEPQAPAMTLAPEVAIRPVQSYESERDGMRRRPSVDRHEDLRSAKGCPSLNTPFSLASVDTNGTALEVSEALAVHMYPHQNSSLLVVDHSARPSEGSDGNQKDGESSEVLETSNNARDLTDNVPVTPPQPEFSLDDVDSPLRNPRAPPEPPNHPPAIKFIPATPSGMTPAYEKVVQMGNYFEATGEKPPRRPSLMRRALTRRRHSLDASMLSSKPPGILSRTFSLSRSGRTRPNPFSRRRGLPEMERGPTYPTADDTPAEENKLHPFWRPQWSSEDLANLDEDWVRDPVEPDEQIYRYPPVDNRPQQGRPQQGSPKRTLSEKVKRTFAILPPRDDDEFYPADDWQGPERRTIRRTPSGNLRVMRHRASLDSLRRSFPQDDRPSTAPDEQEPSFWRGHGVRRRPSNERRRFSIGARLEDIQNIPRRISEKRREKRSQELRQKISGPREVRDGVGDVLRSASIRDQYRANGRF